MCFAWIERKMKVGKRLSKMTINAQASCEEQWRLFLRSFDLRRSRGSPKWKNKMFRIIIKPLVHHLWVDAPGNGPEKRRKHQGRLKTLENHWASCWDKDELLNSMPSVHRFISSFSVWHHHRMLLHAACFPDTVPSHRCAAWSWAELVKHLLRVTAVVRQQILISNKMRQFRRWAISLLTGELPRRWQPAQRTVHRCLIGELLFCLTVRLNKKCQTRVNWPFWSSKPKISQFVKTKQVAHRRKTFQSLAQPSGSKYPQHTPT